MEFFGAAKVACPSSGHSLPVMVMIVLIMFLRIVLVLAAARAGAAAEVADVGGDQQETAESR